MGLTLEDIKQQMAVVGDAFVNRPKGMRLYVRKPIWNFKQVAQENADKILRLEITEFLRNHPSYVYEGREIEGQDCGGVIFRLWFKEKDGEVG